GPVGLWTREDAAMKAVFLAVGLLSSAAIGWQTQRAESPFVISIKHTESGVEMTCERGCGWKTLSFSCEPQKECGTRIDNLGMMRVDDQSNRIDATDLPPG